MRVFEISTVTDRTEVHAGESSELGITVTNKTEGNLNGLLRILPDNSSHTPWISANNNVSYNFAPNGTLDLTIMFSPPETALVESTQCRVILADESNPDENFGDIVLRYEIKLPRRNEKKGFWRIWKYLKKNKSPEPG